MRFIKTNPHPQNINIGDCVVRAVTLATGLPYIKVYNHFWMAGWRHEDSRGTDPDGLTRKLLDDNNIKYEYVDWGNFYYDVADQAEYEDTVEGWCKDIIPTGTYIFRLLSHYCCVKDGVLYDTWDCSQYQPEEGYFKLFL